MKSRVFLNVCFLLWLINVAQSAPLDEAGLSAALDTLIESHPTFQRTTICLKVVDLENGEVLYDRCSDRLLTPASNLKIYTSACALDTFGPEHRFTTRVETTGAIENGTLRGDIVLVGGGDPMLTHEDMAKLAESVLQQWGIQQIEGEIRVDNSRYGSPLKGPGWMWDDDPDYYNMPITSLMLDYNVILLELTQDPEERLSAKPIADASYPVFETVEPAQLPGRRLFWRAPGTDTVLVARTGDLNAFLDDLEENEQPRLTPNDPGKWVAGVFKRMLEKYGVEIVENDNSRQSDSVQDSLEIEGRPLAESLKHFNHVSENAIGEVLLHEIAVSSGTSNPKWADGAKAISNWLVDEAGLEGSSFRLVDGSGLSRYNLISADSAIRLLKYMRDHEQFETFFAALPGYELELENIAWPDTPEEGFDNVRVWAKSGGMSGVSTISGYVRTLDGRMLAFSLLANGFIGRNPRESIIELRKQVWQTLVQYRNDDSR